MTNEILDWTPEWIVNWHQWKKAFEEATRVDEKIGLLRIGFFVSSDRGGYGEPDYKAGERICYYLRLANGHCDSSNMRGKGDGDFSPHNRVRTPHGEVFKLSELRLLVARAAFDTLAVNFFKSKVHEVRRDTYPDWAYALSEGNVLKELMRFFRIAPGRFTSRHTIINFPDKHYQGNTHNGELARQFLDDLICFAWEFRHFGRHESPEDQEYSRRLEKIKPHLVRIMTHTGRIWWLLRPNFPINDACMRVLNNSALTWVMGRHMPIYDSERDRTAATVEEAAADGCQTAQVLLLLRNRDCEHARLEEIRQAKWQAASLERRVEVLQGQ